MIFRQTGQRWREQLAWTRVPYGTESDARTTPKQCQAKPAIPGMQERRNGFCEHKTMKRSDRNFVEGNGRIKRRGFGTSLAVCAFPAAIGNR